MTIPYNTRDGNGKDFTKQVEIKDFSAHLTSIDFECPFCQNPQAQGVPIKKIVSSNFTDWDKAGDYCCLDCSRLFSLYFYNYIVNDGAIRILNIREMAEDIKRPQPGAFTIVITTSQKKHLFYSAPLNHNPEYFGVMLERELIYTERQKLCDLFALVESLAVLGQPKSATAKGVVLPTVGEKLGFDLTVRTLETLCTALKTREIQIPLYIAQKPEQTEEEAKCTLKNLARKA